MRKTNEQSIGQAIDEMLEAYGLKQKFIEHKLISSWDNIMGPTIANRTENLFFRNGVLHVKLNSSVLRNELSLAKTKIIAMLNEAAGQEVVKEIILR